LVDDGRVKWVIELEGGPAFPASAATACGIAASGKPVGYLADVFTRLGAAVAAAKTDDKPPPED
jgi:hypothetical protein